MQTTRNAQDFLSIQVLRTVAAVAVVLFHMLPFESRYLAGATIIPGQFVLGEYGVDLFFIISGFIITRSAKGSFGTKSSAFAFLVRRFTRIYPLYWVYNLVLLAAYLLRPDVFSGARGRPDLIASFLLLPRNGTFLLLVAWTLVFEVQFYVLFSLAMVFVPEKRLALIVFLWGFVITVWSLLFDFPSGPMALFLDKLNLEFIVGCLIAYYVDRLSTVTGLAGLVLGSALLADGSIMFQRPDGALEEGWPRILVAGGGFAGVLLAAVVFEPALRRVIPRFLASTGSWSYSIYLSHLLVLGTVGTLWRLLPVRVGPVIHAIALLSALLASLAFGLVSFRYIEQPLLRMSRRLPAKLQGPTPWLLLTLRRLRPVGSTR